MTTSALLVPADPGVPWSVTRLDPADPLAVARLVGGAARPVRLARPKATFYLAAKAERLGRPANPRARLLARVHDNTFRAHGGTAHGDAVVTGPAGAASLDTDVPDSLRTLLLDTEYFHVQVKRHGKPRWAGSRRIFDDPHVAYVYAARLAAREPDVTDLRVVPARPT